MPTEKDFVFEIFSCKYLYKRYRNTPGRYALLSLVNFPLALQIENMGAKWVIILLSTLNNNNNKKPGEAPAQVTSSSRRLLARRPPSEVVRSTQAKGPPPHGSRRRPLRHGPPIGHVRCRANGVTRRLCFAEGKRSSEGGGDPPPSRAERRVSVEGDSALLSSEGVLKAREIAWPLGDLQGCRKQGSAVKRPASGRTSLCTHPRPCTRLASNTVQSCPGFHPPTFFVVVSASSRRLVHLSFFQPAYFPALGFCTTPLCHLGLHSRHALQPFV